MIVPLVYPSMGPPLRLRDLGSDDPRAFGLIEGVESDLWPQQFPPQSDAGSSFGNPTFASEDIANLLVRTVRPVAIEIPWPYDNAGFPFPAGARLLITCTSPRVWRSMQINGTAATDYAIDFRKHLIWTWYRAVGIPAGSVGTITIERTADWQSGTPTVTEATLTIPAEWGPDVLCLLPDISAPATQRQSCRVYVSSTWTAGAPRYERIAAEHPIILSPDPRRVHGIRGLIIPAELPSGYTERPTTGHEAGACAMIHRNPIPWNATGDTTTAHVLMRGLTRGNLFSTIEQPGLVVTYDGGVGGSRRFGQPEIVDTYVRETSNESDNVSGIHWPEWPLYRWPCVFVGNELKEHRWQPLCYDSLVMLQAATSPAGFTKFDFTPASGTRTGTPQLIDRAPGWRDVRVWAWGLNTTYVTEVRISLMRTADWSAGVPTVTIHTFTFTGASVAGVEGSYQDLGSELLPADDDMDSVLYAQLEWDYSISVPGSVAVAAQYMPARRCDIPPAFSVPTSDGSVAPGGVKDALLFTPTNLTKFTDVPSPGTDAAFTIASGTWNAVARWHPATTGLYTVAAISGGGSPQMRGEYEFGNGGGHLVRAGHACWAIIERRTASTTWRLTKATPVQTAIPAAGLALASGHFTSGTSFHVFLGTIAFPAPGEYRVWMRLNVTFQAAYAFLMAVSASDIYAAEPSTDDMVRSRAVPLFALTSETATPPGSPTHRAQYLVAANATGLWSGRDGMIAVWDQFRSLWHFVTLDANTRYIATIASVFKWRDPETGTWKTAANDWMELRYTAASAGTHYLRLTSDEDEGVFSLLSGLAPTIGWEAL